ncbi:MAG: FxLYD domain-containing protein [Clostridia bacterium]|nr:FxLYD domain-containing protein [Clostridia bacterium]MBR4261682.1 FxLYD domain-containing protein [Clostridia bacterium]
MDRMKLFLKYLLIVVLFFIFSNIMIKAFLKVSFTDMHGYEVNVTGAFVDIKEARASNRNGYIKGIVKNNTDATIENKYLKFSMISKNDIVIGEKYVFIEKMEAEQLREFEVKFDFDHVKTFKVEMVDSKPEEVSFIDLIKTNAQDLIKGINK